MAPGSPETVSAEPRLETLSPQLLVGKSALGSLEDDQTSSLWRAFMPDINSIEGRLDDRLWNVKVFADDVDWQQFSPQTRYSIWAAVAVSRVDTVPDGLEQTQIPGGDYAVFIHYGPASASAPTWNYIFGQWLPASHYELDARPHFELLPRTIDPMTRRPGRKSGFRFVHADRARQRGPEEGR